MNLIDELLVNLPDDDQTVRSVLVGAHWTVVCSRYCGLASTVLGDKPHGHEKVRDVGRLHMKSARELAEYARSEIPLEASLGLAAINSLLAVDERQAVELNAGDLLAEHGKGKNVALVGHFPFIPNLRRTADQLWVIEQRPAEGEYLPEAAGNLIPQADVVALTGSSLINHTLDQLLALCRPDALVVILGPSTPLSPVLFARGASLLSGTRILEEEAVLRTVAQGAMFQQVEGVRLLTIARPLQK
jgi:uncharacterized protein (DUF4213/DUF364 family)